MDYKEKLRLAKEALESGSYDKDTIEYIFPELKESEDERIKKEITELVMQPTWKTEKEFQRRKELCVWLKKQGEQKPANKVDPKFHKGQWITNGDYTWKIVEVKPLDYILQSQGGKIVDDTISHVDEQFHSFTIEDAKDGDVLHSPSHRLIWIYKDNGHYHVCVNMNYVTENITTNGLIIIPNDACLATKDEQTILFAHLKENGYNWDADKRELKKIEQKPTEKEMIEALRTEYEKGRSDAISEMQVAWSKEDERMLNSFLHKLEVCNLLSNKEIIWIKEKLKSLRPQVTWKPSDWQMVSITCAVRKMKESAKNLYHSLMT